jgi:hypothetical protein
MSDVGWRADGIARARAAGGVDLELYRRPGFTGGQAVRVCAGESAIAGYEYDGYSDPPEYELERVPGARLSNADVGRSMRRPPRAPGAPEPLRSRL